MIIQKQRVLASLSIGKGSAVSRHYLETIGKQAMWIRKQNAFGVKGLHDIRKRKRKQRGIAVNTDVSIQRDNRQKQNRRQKAGMDHGGGGARVIILYIYIYIHM